MALMNWRKLGRIFCPNNDTGWLRTHAANPVAERLADDRIRIYFSARDGQNRSHIGFVDIDLRRPSEIIRVSGRPVVSPGKIGTFDDSGASMGCLAHAGRKTYLYYLGWNLGVTVPWRNSIGLCVRKSPDSPFLKHSEAPIVDRDATDPYSISYPWVLRETGVWRMWYGSNLSWGSEKEDMAHVIKYARSSDGLNWVRDGTVALGLGAGSEYALSKPCVIRERGAYRMWFSHRGRAYRIGYAESRDGVRWRRRDGEAGIGVSDSGWDSQSVEYPCVFDHRGRKYMLYNGNAYGKTGFGLAVLER